MFPIRTHYIPKVRFLLLGSCRKTVNQNLEQQPGRCRKPYRVVADIQELEGAVEGCLLPAEATQVMVLVPASRMATDVRSRNKKMVSDSELSKTISSKYVQLADVTVVEVIV